MAGRKRQHLTTSEIGDLLDEDDDDVNDLEFDGADDSQEQYC
jgi:hypothetical protein